MAEIEVREAVHADLSQIAAVALATGQHEEWGGADPAYLTHLLAHGRVVVGVAGGSVAGFGATDLCRVSRQKRRPAGRWVAVLYRLLGSM